MSTMGLRTPPLMFVAPPIVVRLDTRHEAVDRQIARSTRAKRPRERVSCLDVSMYVRALEGAVFSAIFASSLEDRALRRVRFGGWIGHIAVDGREPDVAVNALYVDSAPHLGRP